MNMQVKRVMSADAAMLALCWLWAGMLTHLHFSTLQLIFFFKQGQENLAGQDNEQQRD